MYTNSSYFYKVKINFINNFIDFITRFDHYNLNQIDILVYIIIYLDYIRDDYVIHT